MLFHQNLLYVIVILMLEEALLEIYFREEYTFETVFGCFPSCDVLVKDEELFEVRAERLSIYIILFEPRYAVNFQESLV